jgi:pimeloyl-ACP methyl ester carboxylesterase
VSSARASAEAAIGEAQLAVGTPAGELAVRLCGRPAATGEQDRPWPLLFLHPVNLDARCWGRLAALLPERRMVLPDYRGHGASHHHGPFRIADYAGDALAVMDALGLARVHLVGGSLGGSIACALAGREPGRVASITALGAALEPAEAEVIGRLEALLDAGPPAEAMSAFCDHEVEAGLDPDLVPEILAQFAAGRRPHAVIREVTLNAFSEDGRGYAGAVACPVLMLSGEHDQSCPVDAARRMAEAVRARFEVLPGIGHLPMLQCPRLVADRLLPFLEEVEAT